MPTLIVIDIQKEYTTPGRLFYLHGIEPSLKKAKELLEFCRSQKNWAIAHVQHFRKESGAGGIFNRETPEFSDFVEGFEPKVDEYYFEKSIYSCYSNPKFAQFMEERKHEPIYLIGYGTTKCVLSTAIEGFHRGHRSLVVVADATLAKAEPGFTESDLHKTMLTVIQSSYAKIENTDDIINSAKNSIGLQ